MSRADASDLVEQAAHLAESEHLDVDALPTPPAARRIEDFVRAVGDGLSWIWLVLLGVVVLNVVLRYAFSTGRIELEELQWHLYAVGFLCGLSYCVPSDSHVRVDFLRDRMPPRIRAWVDLYGLILLVLPFVLLVGLSSLPFVAEAWRAGEVSASAGGLPGRWLIKAALPSAMGLLGLAAVARIVRVGALLFGDTPRAGASPADDADAEGR